MLSGNVTDNISSDKILSFMQQDISKLFNIQIFESLPSTNDYLRTLARNNCSEFTVIIAKEQTAGKGRLGRNFFSPLGNGIYLSILLKPKFNTQKLVYITPLTAVALSNALVSNSICIPKIKWVNDLFYKGKKICGILTETCFNTNAPTPEYVIVGAGINLTTPKTGYPADIENIAGPIFENKIPSSATICKLLADFLCSFKNYYDNIEKKPFLQDYKKLSMVINKDIYFTDKETQKKAIVLDIDDEFSLVVKTRDGKIEKLTTGEISIRIK